MQNRDPGSWNLRARKRKMFPFTVKGKVKLGLRKDHHMSVVSLEEDIARRLLDPGKAAKHRRGIGSEL